MVAMSELAIVFESGMRTRIVGVAPARTGRYTSDTRTTPSLVVILTPRSIRTAYSAGRIASARARMVGASWYDAQPRTPSAISIQAAAWRTRARIGCSDGAAGAAHRRRRKPSKRLNPAGTRGK